VLLQETGPTGVFVSSVISTRRWHARLFARSLSIKLAYIEELDCAHFDRAMPEINRVVADQLAKTLLLASPDATPICCVV